MLYCLKNIKNKVSIGTGLLLLPGQTAAGQEPADKPNILFAIADDPAYDEEKKNLKEELFAKLKEQKDPHRDNKGFIKLLDVEILFITGEY